VPIRKRFGQHFLHDKSVIARIIAAIAPSPGEALVEIGPGPGAITAPLLEACGELDAVEIDRDLAAELRARFAAHKGFRLHVADALKFDWAALARERGQPLRLVGNLPYNISTPLLFRLLDNRASILDMHFMLQKEVVDRIVAAPDSDAYGRLGVMLAPFVIATPVLEIGPGAFRPPPKVRSAVVRLALRRDLAAWASSPSFAAVVAAAFGQRRKTLRNSLGKLLSEQQLRAAGVDPAARAETLSAEQFGALALVRDSVLH
jgi:16S rRNA (adenine1518-N6/adenine1519-N6)-dimethyltransferase